MLLKIYKKDFKLKGLSNYVLIFLLAIDVFFIIAHILVVNFWWLESKRLLLDSVQLGYPEGFQYVKYLGLITMIIHSMTYKKKIAYLPLLILFIFLLIDDAFQLHIKASSLIIDTFDFNEFSRIKSEILGKLIYVLLVAIVFIGIFLPTHMWSAKWDGKYPSRVFLFLGLFLFFGVGVDLLQTLFERGTSWSKLLTLTEEGGEMLTLSVLVWYCYNISIKQIDT